MNKELIEIFSVIHNGLRGVNRDYNIKSASDTLCERVIHTGDNSCNAEDRTDCRNCLVGYYHPGDYATSLIQVFKINE